MASSKVAVCNNALGELGEKAITSLSDAKESARLCNLFFDDVVRFVLREHDWGSASKRQQLSRLAAAPDFGFAYQYELPNDWIKTTELDIDELGEKWSQEDGKILTDAEAVHMKYVYFLNNPAKWDSHLTETIEAYLAYKLSLGIAGKVQYKDAMYKLYNDRLNKAKGINSFEKTQDELVSTVLIDCRR